MILWLHYTHPKHSNESGWIVIAQKKRKENIDELSWERLGIFHDFQLPHGLHSVQQHQCREQTAMFCRFVQRRLPCSAKKALDLGTVMLQ